MLWFHNEVLTIFPSCLVLHNLKQGVISALGYPITWDTSKMRLTSWTLCLQFRVYMRKPSSKEKGYWEINWSKLSFLKKKGERKRRQMLSHRRLFGTKFLYTRILGKRCSIKPWTSLASVLHLPHSSSPHCQSVGRLYGQNYKYILPSFNSNLWVLVAWNSLPKEF